MSFVKSRLNKDNFWNMMFWFGITLCLAISEYFNGDKLLGFIFLWIAILGVPFTVKQIQDVKFDKKYGFFNASGRSLKDSMPEKLGLAIISSVALVGLIGVINNKFFSITLYGSLFFLIPTLYFIYKNCPISILFNKNAFKPFSAAELVRINKISTSRSTTSFSPPDYICDIKYRFMSSNIHNHNRYRR